VVQCKKPPGGGSEGNLIFWFLLQGAIIVGVVWLIDEPDLTSAAAFFGVLAALIVTALLSRLIDWVRSRPRQDTDPHRGVDGSGAIGRHPSDSAKLIDGRRVREDVR
jgi:hypothetical protein